MKRYMPFTNYKMIEVGGSYTGSIPHEQFVLASDVADLERRYRDAVELIEKLRGGVERYSSDLCREADQFLDDDCLTGRYTD